MSTNYPIRSFQSVQPVLDSYIDSALGYFGWTQKTFRQDASKFFGTVGLVKKAQARETVKQREAVYKRGYGSFVNGWEFLENLFNFRLLYIGGRMGGFKTSLGMALCKWLYERQDHGVRAVRGIFTNVPTNPKYIPRVHSCFGTAVMFDEGWINNSARGSQNRSSLNYGAFARKLQSYWIQPSKIMVDKETRDLTCRRSIEIWIIDAQMYAWEDNSGAKGWFLWRHYQDVFGQYVSGFIPASDGGILANLKEEVAKRSGDTGVILLPGHEGWLD